MPGESKAEYDIIAMKDQYLLIIEAKAYTPETRFAGYSETQRLKRGIAFAKKLRLKAKFIAHNISKIPKVSVGAQCSKLIPVLLSTYPFTAKSLSEGVVVLTEAELLGLIMTPDRLNESIIINISSKSYRD